MKWCSPHWQQLRQAIEIRGLSKFGAQNAQEAFSDITDQLDGEKTQFDPLLGCFWRINNAAMEIVGLRLMGHCPLCLMVEDGYPQLVSEWINGHTDAALKYAIGHGLVKSQ